MSMDLDVEIGKILGGRKWTVVVRSRSCPTVYAYSEKWHREDALGMVESLKAKVVRDVEARKAAMRSAGNQTEARQSIFAD